MLRILRAIVANETNPARLARAIRAMERHVDHLSRKSWARAAIGGLIHDA
jgi:hypothetical protein